MRIKGALLVPLMIFLTINLGRQFLVSEEGAGAGTDEAVTTKDECLGLTAERQARCTSPGCEQLVFARMQQCLDEAEGDKEIFCENVEFNWRDSTGRDIFETHCAPHSPYEFECEKMIGQVGGYCARLI